MKLVQKLLSTFKSKDGETHAIEGLKIAASLHPTKGWRKGESSSRKVVEVITNNGTRINLRKQKA